MRWCIITTRNTNLPVLLRLETDASTVGTATLVTTTECGSAGKGNSDQLAVVHPKTENSLLKLRDVAVVDDRTFNRGNRVFPKRNLVGNLRTEPAGSGAHVTVKELEPCAREGLVQLLGVLEEATGDLVVDRVETESQIGGEHSRLVLLVGVVGIRDDLVISLGLPLVRASGAVNLLPLILVHILEVVVAWDSVSGYVKVKSIKDNLLHLVGVLVQITSRPLVMVSGPLPDL